jgi:hypothetical protein
MLKPPKKKRKIKNKSFEIKLKIPFERRGFLVDDGGEREGDF